MAGDDQPLRVAERSWYREALREPDPRRSLCLYVRNAARMQERHVLLSHKRPIVRR